MFGYKNMFYVIISIILLLGGSYLGFFMKEDFENKKKESELKGYEKLKTIHAKSDNDFKPKKTSELKTCNSNNPKSCLLY